MFKSSLKITCSNGNYWYTDINLSFAEACDYFFGSQFFDRNDKLQRVVRVETV